MPRVRVIKVPVDSGKMADQPQNKIPNNDESSSGHLPAEYSSDSQTISLNKRTLKRALLVAGALLLVLVTISVMKSDSNKEQSPQASTQTITPQNEAEQFHRAVKAIAEVPNDQIPSMLPIDQQDANNLVNQNPELFKNAISGDKVLLYTKQVEGKKSALFVLYRPSSNKVVTMIEVASNAQNNNKQ